MMDWVAQTSSDLGEYGAALFSRDMRHRFLLSRVWAAGPLVCFLMLNPSTADAFQLDPTVRRCRDFARRWHYGGVVIANLFSIRATDPREMLADADPTAGDENDRAIELAAAMAARVVCAWGVHGAHQGRGDLALRKLDAHNHSPMALGFTKAGHPRHPLYLRNDASVVCVAPRIPIGGTSCL